MLIVITLPDACFIVFMNAVCVCPVPVQTMEVEIDPLSGAILLSLTLSLFHAFESGTYRSLVMSASDRYIPDSKKRQAQ